MLFICVTLNKAVKLNCARIYERLIIATWQLPLHSQPHQEQHQQQQQQQQQQPQQPQQHQ